MILSKLNMQDLVCQARRRDFTKWWSLCLMRGLGLPTLDAALIEPGTPGRLVREKLEEFLHSIACESVLVRSDFNGETGSYRRGGITYESSDAYSAIMAFIENNRAVILLEPTNRFSNILSINMTMGKDGTWFAESLSCGFDTSDLQRGLVTPQWIWEGNIADRAIPKAISIDSVSHEERVSQRLNSISALFGIEGIYGYKLANNFLVASNNTCLFTVPKSPPQSKIRKIKSDAEKISSSIECSDFPYTLSYAKLWDGRSIYWDITPGKRKWNLLNPRAEGFHSSQLQLFE